MLVKSNIIFQITNQKNNIKITKLWFYYLASKQGDILYSLGSILPYYRFF